MSIEVMEQNGYTFIRKDGLTQSMIPSPDGGYWEKMIPENFIPQSALILGLGAGTIYKMLREKFPDIEISAVDNNAEMVAIAYGNGVNAHEIWKGDAFDFIKDVTGKYSLIIVDLFDGMNFNMKVITDLFLNDCKRCLNPGGYLVVNVPNLSQCEHNFQEAKRNDVQNIYFYRAGI